jgi:hypothetical protein
MKIEINRAWRVRAHDSLDLALPATKVWWHMRDLPTFLCIDPLHAQVIISDHRAPSVQASSSHAQSFEQASLVIRHRLLGIGPDRIGRVLRWREGRGYVISDLSKRGVRVGFPHVCSYEVLPISNSRCRLTLEVRGVWTARWNSLFPRLCAKAWLAWVMAATASRVRLHFAPDT